jgi:SnoaL-like domain
MDEADLTRRVGELEVRLREMEDRAAILEVIASYGPAADSSDGKAIQALFSASGTYELEGWSFTHDDMPETVNTDLHARYEIAGSAHVMSLPRIDVDGDRAVALNYSQVFVAHDAHWVVDRCAANRWELVREPDGWKVSRRVNRLLNGSAESHALLSGVEPPPLT